MICLTLSFVDIYTVLLATRRLIRSPPPPPTHTPTHHSQYTYIRLTLHTHTEPPPAPACACFYNLFYEIDPMAGRIEPLLDRRFSNVTPVLLPPYRLYPTGRHTHTHTHTHTIHNTHTHNTHTHTNFNSCLPNNTQTQPGRHSF